MRFIYSLILYLMLPWVLLRLWLKGSCLAAYRKHWGQRLGYVRAESSGVVWVHAVSVGELRGAQALIEGLLAHGIGRPILITTTTPTGRQTAQRLFGQTVSYRYLPYDLPPAVNRFLDAVRPVLAVIMETEIWPNLYHQIHKRGVPLMLLNARLSRSSLHGYLKLPGLSRAAIRSVTRIAAQTEDDAQRFVRLGAADRQLSVVGNLKYDIDLPTDFDERLAALKNRIGVARPIWVAGSTHAGEEVQLIGVHRRMLQRHPHALLILAPRHPERASAVAQLCERSGLAVQYFSRLLAGVNKAGVVVVDTVGDLVYLYGLARVAFVGGSLIDRGGHNPVEALLAGAPVVSGSSVYNFQVLYQDMVKAGAAQLIATEAALADQLGAWLFDQPRCLRAAEAGLRMIEKNRGATQRCLAILLAELAASQKSAAGCRSQ